MKIHMDLDCYFVSAERSRHSFLKGKNVVVAKGSDNEIFSDTKKEWRFIQKTGAFSGFLDYKNKTEDWREEFIDENGYIRAIVIAKSYEAKRYGIKTGMKLSEALSLCRDLIVIKSDHLFYQELSQKLKSFLKLKIPLLEQYSIDEFFGDLGGWIKDEETLPFITSLRDEILKEFDLPITIAAAKSKWTAKLLTDKIKPFGASVLKEEETDSFIKRIPIDDFPGIGKSISERLKDYGIKTLGELKNYPQLLNRYGKNGKTLYKRICGSDNEKVIPFSDRRAIGISRNFKPVYKREEILKRALILTRYLSYTILKLKLNPTTFYYKIRYEYGTKSSKSITKKRVFSEYFLRELTKEMIKKIDIDKNQKIKYIAISASNFISISNPKTLSLFEYKSDFRVHRLEKTLLPIKDKYGIDTIKWG